MHAFLQKDQILAELKFSYTSPFFTFDLMDPWGSARQALLAVRAFVQTRQELRRRISGRRYLSTLKYFSNTLDFSDVRIWCPWVGRRRSNSTLGDRATAWVTKSIEKLLNNAGWNFWHFTYDCGSTNDGSWVTSYIMIVLTELAELLTRYNH